MQLLMPISDNLFTHQVIVCIYYIYSIVHLISLTIVIKNYQNFHLFIKYDSIRIFYKILRLCSTLKMNKVFFNVNYITFQQLNYQN